MQNDALNVVKLRYEFYRDGYRSILGLVIISVIVNSMLAYSVYYMASNPQPARYFATSPDGHIIPIKPLNEAVYATAEILAWSTNLAITAYSYDYVNYRTDLQSLASSFTSEGWSNFLTALKGSRMLDTVMSQKLVMKAEPTGAPIVQQQGVLNHRYAWKITIPMLITLTGTNNNIQQIVKVDMLIQRVSLVNNPKGVAVSSFIASEN